MYAKFILLGLLTQLSYAVEKITYNDHIRAIFKADCSECHNPNKAKGGLDLMSYAQTMIGSSAGEVLSPGDINDSILFESITSNDSDMRMPPKGARVSSENIALIKKWIESGILESKTSKRKIVVKSNNFEFNADDKQQSYMPKDLSKENWTKGSYSLPINAMAASPTSPLIAVSAYQQILLYSSENSSFLGSLYFPEGRINDLVFSRNGRFLLAAGGQQDYQGHAVIWEVETGKRIFHLEHPDNDIFCADISPDMKVLALGSNDKKIKFYKLQTHELIYQEKIHSEWINALRFSPDGQYLASADRNGQVIIWSALDYSRLHSLYRHKNAVNQISWRPDSKIFASAGQDGVIYFWDPKAGRDMKNIKGPSAGIFSVNYDAKGRFITCYSNREVKIFDSDYKQIFTKKLEGHLLLRTVLSDEKAFVGNFNGRLQSYDLKGKELSSHFTRYFGLQAKLKNADAELSSQLEKEKLNHLRHIELLDEFRQEENLRKAQIEQLYFEADIKDLEKELSNPKAQLAELNQLYRGKIKAEQTRAQLKFQIQKSQEKQALLYQKYKQQ